MLFLVILPAWPLTFSLSSYVTSLQMLSLIPRVSTIRILRVYSSRKREERTSLEVAYIGEVTVYLSSEFIWNSFFAAWSRGSEEHSPR